MSPVVWQTSVFPAVAIAVGEADFQRLTVEQLIVVVVFVRQALVVFGVIPFAVA